MVTGLVIPLHNIKELLSRNCTYISVKCIQTQLLFCKQIYPCGYRILKYGGILVEMWLSYSPIVNHVLWSNLASLITQGKYYQSILYVHKVYIWIMYLAFTKQNKTRSWANTMQHDLLLVKHWCLVTHTNKHLNVYKLQCPWKD